MVHNFVPPYLNVAERLVLFGDAKRLLPSSLGDESDSIAAISIFF